MTAEDINEPAYHAVLKYAEWFGPVINGSIYADKKHRFVDGYPIHTSEVLSGPDEAGIITTKNSRYLIDHETSKLEAHRG